MFISTAPIRNVPIATCPWWGNCPKKPWDYPVTLVLPTIDQPSEVALAIRAWRCQTVRPYILVVDTGSLMENFNRVVELRAPDVEVWQIATNGVEHSSDLVAIANDCAFSRISSRWAFTTHTDVFPRRRDIIERWLEYASSGFPVVAYLMSPRIDPMWEHCPSHACSLWDMHVWDGEGLTWSLRRWERVMGRDVPRVTTTNNGWPDTESTVGLLMHKRGLKFYQVGKETNHVRFIDEWIDHCRSMTCSQLYSPEYYSMCRKWYAEASAEALVRIEDWERGAVWKSAPH